MPSPRTRGFITRCALVVLGTTVSSLGYLLTVRAELGNGPLFVVQDALNRRWGLPLGIAAAVVGLGLAGLALGLRARLGFATVAIPLLTGVAVALLESLVPELDGLAARWIAFSAGTTIMMLGVVVAIRAGLGPSALDGVMLALSDRTGLGTARVRLGMEFALAAVGIILGGRAGVGTAAMAAAVGPLFSFWDSARGWFRIPRVRSAVATADRGAAGRVLASATSVEG